MKKYTTEDSYSQNGIIYGYINSYEVLEVPKIEKYFSIVEICSQREYIQPIKEYKYTIETTRKGSYIAIIFDMSGDVYLTVPLDSSNLDKASSMLKRFVEKEFSDYANKKKKIKNLGLIAQRQSKILLISRL